MTSTHYGNSQNPENLFPWARKMAQNITRRYLRNKNYGILPILGYRGMSGVAAATAIMAFIPAKYQDAVGMMYIRKPNEQSHGSDIEYTSNTTFMHCSRYIPIICDDFIDDGDTVTEVAKAMMQHLQWTNVSVNDIQFALSSFTDDSTLKDAREAFRKVWMGEAKYDNFIKMATLAKRNPQGY